MKYLRKVDFDAYERRGYEAQYLYNGESRDRDREQRAGGAPPRRPTTSIPSTQLYYVIEGEMQLQLGSDRHVAGADTLVYIPPAPRTTTGTRADVDEFHFEVLAPAPPPNQDLMTRPTQPSSVIGPTGSRHGRRRLHRGAAGFAVQRLLATCHGSEHVSLYVATVEPGGAGPAIHVHAFDQFYYVLDGTMSLQIGLERYTAGRHSLVILPPGCHTASGTKGPRSSATSRCSRPSRCPERSPGMSASS